MPISTTAAVWWTSIPRSVAGVPMSLLKLAGLRCVGPFSESTVARIWIDDPKATGRETAVKVGETWDAPKQLVMRPLPMQLDTKYTLTKLTDEHAHISVFGTISPATAKPMGANASELITLTGGHTIGNCVIFRETGLPMKSNVERRIDMEVQIDNRRKFKQHKIIQTTVESFPTDQAFLSGTSRTGARGRNPPPVIVDPQARGAGSSATSRTRRPLPQPE